MRAPPAAVWRVQRDPRWQALHALLYGLAGAVVSLWALQHAAQRWFWDQPPAHEIAFLAGAAAACLALASMAAAFGWRSAAQAEGRVLWTGQRWRWQADDKRSDSSSVRTDKVCNVRVQALLDTGNWLLLRVKPTGAAHHSSPAESTRYLSLRGPQGQQPGGRVQWAGFRAAVYSAASRQGGLVPPNSPLTE